MSTSAANTKLIALREEFDRSFAHAPGARDAAPENLLAIRLSDVPHAIRVAQIGGLYADRHVMPLPTPATELLGIAAFRGQLAPVYDLAALLGYTRHASPRWLVLLRIEDSIAFAFDGFDAHIAVRPDQILRGGEGQRQEAPQQHGHDAVRTSDGILPIIDLHSIVDNIRRQYATTIKTKGKSS